MHMPEMDGLETTEKILELNTGIPIVAMTANIMSHERELYSNSGMVDYVGKPFTSQELWKCLMKFFTPVSWKTEDKDRYTRTEDKFLQKITKSFVLKNQDKYTEIEDAIIADDIKLAHRLVHTLKANAGQLKKTKLQKAAEDVENRLKTGENLVTPEQMNILKNELSTVLIELSPLVQETTSSDSAVSKLDDTAARELLEKLELLLEDSDSDCLLYVDDLRSLPGSEALIQRIEDFEFIEALKLLTDLMDNY